MKELLAIVQAEEYQRSMPTGGVMTPPDMAVK
jgi:hypothetical protein